MTPDQQDIISTAMSLPANVATEVVSAVRDIQTKQEVTEMMRPLIKGFTENTVHTNKLQIDYDTLEKRIKALEVIFNAGEGYNFIYDKLVGKIADEVSVLKTMAYL